VQRAIIPLPPHQALFGLMKVRPAKDMPREADKKKAALKKRG
jgi:hypothetical protein